MYTAEPLSCWHLKAAHDVTTVEENWSHAPIKACSFFRTVNYRFPGVGFLAKKVFGALNWYYLIDFPKKSVNSCHQYETVSIAYPHLVFGCFIKGEKVCPCC